MFEFLANSFGSTLGKTLASAAVGALVSGAVTALNGGKFEEGAKRGAVIGGGVGLASSLFSGTGGENTAPASPDSPMAPGGNAPPPAQGPIQQSLNQPPQNQGGLLNGINNMSANQMQLFGTALSGGAQAYASMEAAESAAEQAEKNREFERERMENQNNQFFVNWGGASGGTDWNKYLENARAATRSA